MIRDAEESPASYLERMNVIHSRPARVDRSATLGVERRKSFGSSPTASGDRTDQ